MPKVPAGKSKLVNRGPAGLLKKSGGKLTNRGPAGLLTKVSNHAIGDYADKSVLVAVDRDKAKKNNILCDGEVVNISSLVPDTSNARLHPERNIEAIMDSLCLYGQRVPLVVRKKDRMVAAGNGRLEAAKLLGWTKIAVSIRPMTDVEFHGFALADNRSAELARWDFEVVARLDKLLQESKHATIGWAGEELQALRAADWSKAQEEQAPTVNLSDRFIVPPFSVLDARQGYWQERKRQWLALGIQSELGRGGSA